jgi:hypothetical protein
VLKKLIAVLLCVSVSVLTLSGCAKKKAETTTEQAAPADSTAAAVDTTRAAQ